MKNLLLLLFFCYPLILFGQSNTKLEFLGSFDYSHRHHTNPVLRQSFSSSDVGKLNTHFNINYYQKLKAKLWLKIGVGFVSEGYKTRKTKLITGGGVTGMTQDPLLQGIDNPTSQFIYNFHFLEVPFSLHYDFSEKKLKPFVEFGLVPMYYLQSITKFELNGEIREKRNEQESIINDFQLATKIAFGFSYAFNEKWDLIVQPNFRYHINKIVSPINEHLWSVGLAVGIRMAME